MQFSPKHYASRRVYQKNLMGSNAWEGIAPQSRYAIKRKLLFIIILADVAGLRSNPLPSITKQGYILILIQPHYEKGFNTC